MTLEDDAGKLARLRQNQAQSVADRYRRVVSIVDGLAREFAPAAPRRRRPELQADLKRPCWIIWVVNEAGQNFGRHIAIYEDGSWAWVQYTSRDSSGSWWSEYDE